MALTIEQQKSQGISPSGPTGSDAGNPMTQITSSPIALAQRLIYEVMEIYGKIIALESKQKVFQIQAQVSTAKAQADATAKAGKEYGKALIYGGIAMIATAVAGLAVSIAYDQIRSSNLTIRGKKIGLNIRGEENDVAEKLEPMSKLEKVLDVEPYAGHGGDNPEELPMNSAVRKRLAEFREGNFQNAGSDDVSKEAIRRMKSMSSEPKDIEMRDFNNPDEEINQPEEKFDYEKWKDHFDQKLDRLTRGQNNVVMKRNTLQQQGTMASDFVKKGGEFASQYYQATGTAEQAKQNAAATILGTTSQMAGSSVTSLDQEVTKKGDEMNSEVQILDKMQQASSVNG